LDAQPNKDKIKSLILKVVAKEKPENTEKLKQIMQQQQGINPELTTQVLLELENEGKLRFEKPETPTPASVKEYVFSQKALWYWGIIALSIATTISVFTIPESTYPIAYVRNVLGIIFVLILPGYAFIKALFPAKLPFKTSSENLDNIERIAHAAMAAAVVRTQGDAGSCLRHRHVSRPNARRKCLRLDGIDRNRAS